MAVFSVLYTGPGIHTRARVCKSIPVTGRGGLQGCEMLRIPHILENTLTDGGEVVSLTRQPPFTLKKDVLLLISVRS
jgi:hypothetical protein